jgi:hypothetical protein
MDRAFHGTEVHPMPKETAKQSIARLIAMIKMMIISSMNLQEPKIVSEVR